ncbi:MAG: alpha/beta hydrolase [Bdellovibrionaceae bacterium]|nr:alpha/beta hydrolase [Bdellovibrionales bacterium]MCB9083367.1 alpha/beta hydrolase [Pseudobdellovibrionaceae bacterium]
MTKDKPALWVFLRGLGREKGHWGNFVDEFQASFPGEEVLCVDLPGAGDARDVPPPTSLASMTDFVRHQVHQAAGGERPINLLSISLGGMVTLEWMRRHPHELHFVVIMNTSAAGLNPFYRRLRLSAAPRFLSSAFVRDPHLRERKIVDLISNRREVHDQTAEQWYRLGQERPVNRRSVARQLLAASRFRLPRQMPSVPTLLMVGQGDRLVHPDCTEALHRHYGWEIARHPWAGHDLPLDDAPWIFSEIRKWRNQNGF